MRIKHAFLHLALVLFFIGMIQAQDTTPITAVGEEVTTEAAPLVFLYEDTTTGPEGVYTVDDALGAFEKAVVYAVFDWVGSEQCFCEASGWNGDIRRPYEKFSMLVKLTEFARDLRDQMPPEIREKEFTYDPTKSRRKK